MRHAIAGNRLNRFSSWRKATVRDIAKATLLKQRIFTTKVKAKEARKLVDQLITLGKKGTLADKRRAFAILCDHELVSSLFSTMAPRFQARQGGYTRIIKVGNRRGDNAEIAILELTEVVEVVKKKIETTEKTKKKSTDATAEVETSDKSAKASSKDHNKVADKTILKDKPKNIMGGLKKMFNRKVGGE